MRRIEVTIAGRWFLAFTIVMGVTALASSNNVLYLLEALLLSGLIVSGVLSERTIYTIDVDFQRRPATAGVPVHDTVRVRNRGRLTHFCVEIGEWRDHRFHPVAYVPVLQGREELIVPVKQTLPARGVHRWDGICVATSFPFGFARKVYVMKERGERLVWPLIQPKSSGRRNQDDARSSSRAGIQFAEGEIRPMNQDDDARMVVWTLSAKGRERMVRHRRADEAVPTVSLDTRCAPGAAFEESVVRVAAPFHAAPGEEGGTLVLLGPDGRRKLVGRRRILDTLATVQASARAAGGGSP